MERVLPHVAAGQRLIKGEHHRVVLSIRLMAPLSDPAFVVCQWTMKTPGKDTRDGNSKAWALIKSHSCTKFRVELLLSLLVLCAWNQDLQNWCTWCRIRTCPFQGGHVWSSGPALYHSHLPASYLMQKDWRKTLFFFSFYNLDTD